MTTKDTRDDEQRAKALAAESTVKQRIRMVLSEYGPCTSLRAVGEIFKWEADGQPRFLSAGAAVFYTRLMGAASLVGDMAELLGGVPVSPPPPDAGEVGVANRLRLLLGDIVRATPLTVQELGAGCDRIAQLSKARDAMLKETSLEGGAPLGNLVRMLHGERYNEAEGVTMTSIVIDAHNEIRRLRDLPHAKSGERIRELERTHAIQREMLVVNEGSTLGVLAKLLRGPDALAGNPDFFDIVGGAHDEITMLRAQVGRLSDLKTRLDVVEGEVKKTSDEYTAARAELRDHEAKARTHDSVAKSLLSELHEVLIEQVPDIALSMSASEVVKLATETIENLSKQRDETLTKGNVEALRKALRRFTKRSDADLDTLNASIIEANAAPLVTTDKITGHPIGCEAHFAGIRFHCHKTSRKAYADRRQTFVTVEVYATTALDREAIEALRHHAEAGTVATLHAPAGCGIKGYGRLTSWPAHPVSDGEEAIFQFELHATKKEGEEASRHRHGHQGHADAARADLVKASNELRSRVGLFPDGDLLTKEDLAEACKSIDEMIERSAKTPATIFALDENGEDEPSLSGAPPAPLNDTDPRAMVRALIAEHGSYGKPFDVDATDRHIASFTSGVSLASLDEPIKLTVALIELEAQAPTDLKGYGFTDATMLSPVPSNAARSHVATCLAYAGLLHDLRQALQRSFNGLAISARHNAEQSSDMLAYWTAELARMPVPTSGYRPAS
jgi:hypothetical protein